MQVTPSMSSSKMPSVLRMKRRAWAVALASLPLSATQWLQCSALQDH